MTWITEWNDILITGESYFCLHRHDGTIRVKRNQGERLLKCCVMHRRTGPAHGIKLRISDYESCGCAKSL
ncbi:hypothetical protein TNCV_3973451 [Trichonephila clavipes]|nr:hypothetical protein TNCV_3973451 [Trichonephila clavipes]